MFGCTSQCEIGNTLLIVLAQHDQTSANTWNANSMQLHLQIASSNAELGCLIDPGNTSIVDYA